MKYSEFMQASRDAFENRGSGLTIIEDSFCILMETGEVFTALVRDGNPGVGRGVTWMALSDNELENLKRHLNK